MMNHWDKEKNKLSRTFVFSKFISAWGFMIQVALVAEKMNHHPDWRNSYDTVEINLTTHNAGNTVTEKDRALARAIDEIFEQLKK